MLRAKLFALLLVAALPAPALAQAYQCAAPERVKLPPPPKQDGPTRRVAVGGFTLAASWSPEYCRGNRAADDSLQCSGRSGRFGFVLHGLWPEAVFGPPPQWCSLSPRPSPESLRQNLCMSPSPSLLEHEWAKHGSCAAKTPEAYFRMSRTAWQSLVWPDVDRLSRKEGLIAGDLRQAFLAANPGWRTDAVGVIIANRGWLRELRLCYDRGFKPAPCSSFQRGVRDGKAIKIWRGL